jgi:hypothetical protein
MVKRFMQKAVTGVGNHGHDRARRGSRCGRALRLVGRRMALFSRNNVGSSHDKRASEGRVSRTGGGESSDMGRERPLVGRSDR